MTKQDKRNVKELYDSLVRTYNLLDDSTSGRYIEDNSGERAKQSIKGLIEDLMRDFPDCRGDIYEDFNF